MRQTLLLNVVVLSFFVLLFSSIYRRRPSERLRLWIAAWLCAIAQFAVLCWHPGEPALRDLVSSASAVALVLAGMCLILSVPAVHAPVKRRNLVLGVFLPMVAFAVCVNYHVAVLPVLIGLALVGHLFGIIFLWLYMGRYLLVAVPSTALLFLGSHWVLAMLLRSHGMSALGLMLMELFAIYALLFARDFWRNSAGVWTTIVGLLGWAAVFPVSMLVTRNWPAAPVHPEIWDVPKVVVAFGLLVTLFEDELTLAEEEREQYRRLFDGNPLPMWVSDPATLCLLEANAAAEREFGWTRDEFAAMRADDLLFAGKPNQGEQNDAASLAALNERLGVTAPEARPDPAQPAQLGGEPAVQASPMQFRTKAGQSVLVELTLQRIVFRSQPARLLMAKDISAQVRAHEQLVYQAHHDALTGLPNRLLLADRLKGAMAGAMRRGNRCAVLCLDLDRFKQINDTLGHAAGDDCLREVARRLSQRLRSVDTAARTGGEEFMVILDDIVNAADAERVALDLLLTLAVPHTVEGAEVRLSASIGIALFPDDGHQADQLWSRADNAMYRAKQGGGNRHRFYARGR